MERLLRSSRKPKKRHILPFNRNQKLNNMLIQLRPGRGGKEPFSCAKEELPTKESAICSPRNISVTRHVPSLLDHDIVLTQLHPMSSADMDREWAVFNTLSVRALNGSPYRSLPADRII